MTGGFIECEVIITCLYDGSQGVSEVGKIVWRGLGSFFMVEQLVCKTLCFWKSGLGVMHYDRYKEGNEAKYLGYDISPLELSLDYFASP